MYYSWRGKPFSVDPRQVYIWAETDDQGHVTVLMGCDKDGVIHPEIDYTKTWNGDTVHETWWPIQLGDPDLMMDVGL